MSLISKIVLIQHNILEYPSASGIELYQDKYFIIGDDSNKILCLNKNLKFDRDIILFEFEGKRIAKKDKPDFEACTIYNHNLLLFSSGSKLPERSFLYQYNLIDHSIGKHDLLSFYELLLSKKSIKELNIEGITSVQEHFLFFNRANNNQDNSLIVVNNFNSYLENKLKLKDLEIRIIEIEIPTFKKHKLGISGATYHDADDILFLTASAENTDNAYDDGEILGSVICIIKNASKEVLNSKIIISDYINLEDVDATLRNQKIESICIQNYDANKYNITLVADNDVGNSEIFCLEMYL
jgi:hypothetical protein